jgi:hypothetical protein
VFDEAASGVRSDTEDEVTQANLVMHGLRALLSGSEEEITDAVIGGIQNSTEIPNFEKTSLISKLADMDGSIPDLITKAAMCLTGGSAALDLGPFHVRSPKDLYEARAKLLCERKTELELPNDRRHRPRANDLLLLCLRG